MCQTKLNRMMMKYVERDGSQGCFSSLWITQKFELLHQLCRVSRQLPCRDMPGLEVQWKTPTVGASNGMSRRPFTGLRSLLSSTVNHVDDSEKSGVHQVRLVGNDLWFVGFLYIQTVLGNGISTKTLLSPSALSFCHIDRTPNLPFLSPKGKQFHQSPASNGTKNHLIGLCSRTVSGVNISPTQTNNALCFEEIHQNLPYICCLFHFPKRGPM